MNNLRPKKIIIIQLIIWTVFYIASAILLRTHFGIKLDNFFIFRYSLLIITFFTFDIWLISRLLRPKVEELESKMSKNEKEFNITKDHLEIENRLYKILVDSLEDPVFVITNQLEIFFYNQKLSEFFKLSASQSKIPFIQVSRNLEFQTFIQNSIKNNQISEIHNFTFGEVQDPNKKFFDLKLIPIKFSSHYLCILHDVTERKRADQIREDFISNFSHEIRTPLTILNGQIQNLRNLDINLGDKNKINDHFNKIENNSRRLTSLFDDMLSLTSIEKQKDLNIEVFDIEPMIYFVTQDLSLKYPTKKLDFQITIGQNQFSADYNLIEQVLINLIDNAIKYSKNDGQIATITISTQKDDTFNNIVIADAGVGIPEEQKHRIFERFFRIDISRSSEITGTGLGLAIVKHIISKHQGKIKVNSSVNIGTTMTISLPQ